MRILIKSRRLLPAALPARRPMLRQMPLWRRIRVPRPLATEEVDPIAEAEVYIAYGRDGQAEEILKEAMSRDPSREDVQVKLAEVYAARQDTGCIWHDCRLYE